MVAVNNLRAPIAIVIPVGPYPHHRKYLPEMIRSIEEQTIPPSEVIFVDDGGGIQDGTEPLGFPTVGTCQTRVVKNRWNLGVPASMNVGIGSSAYDLMIMACADDRLFPNCVELCWNAWLTNPCPLGYYYFGIRYSTGNEQNTPCGAAMVTRELWRRSGGFPPECAVGAADHIFLHCMLVASKEKILPVEFLKVSDELIYWYRQESNGATSNNIWPAIEACKATLTERWLRKAINQVAS